MRGGNFQIPGPGRTDFDRRGATAQADPLGPAVDAFVNLGASDYPAASFIVAGNPQPWYDSAPVAGLFGGTPTAQQQQGFDQAVMQDIQKTFQLSGISISLTDNPAASALHTLSLVSNASSAPFPGAIGTTDLGANGFSFIDPIAQAAQSVNQLEWIVAHNISHELMLAFGVNENYDQTGNYIDAGNAKLSKMIDPNATFSAAAAQALAARLGPLSLQRVIEPGAQAIAPTATAPTAAAATATPEPSTLALVGDHDGRGRRGRTVARADALTTRPTAKPDGAHSFAKRSIGRRKTGGGRRDP